MSILCYTVAATLDPNQLSTTGAQDGHLSAILKLDHPDAQAITSIFVHKESVSGDTIETDLGRRYRTDSKSHKVFSNYKIALIGRMQLLGQTHDEEYEYLLNQVGLRKTTPHKAKAS